MDINIFLERIEFLSSQKGIAKTKAFIESGIGKDFSYNLKKSSPSLDKVIALADYFNVTIDFLLGRDISGKEDPVLNLTRAERDILEAFRHLEPIEQGELLGRARTMSEQHEQAYKQDA